MQPKRTVRTLAGLILTTGVLLAAPEPAHANTITLTYVGDVEGVQGVMRVTYEDLRIPAGSVGWWAANYHTSSSWPGTDGRIYIAGDLDTGVARYVFTAEVFGSSTFGYGDMFQTAPVSGSSFRIYLEWPDAFTSVPLRRFDLVPNPFLDGRTVYSFELASSALGECFGADDCVMMLATSLPSAANAPDRKSRKVAKSLAKLLRKATKSAVKAAFATPGSRKQRKQYKKTKNSLQKLQRKARKADEKGRLNTDLTPIDEAVDTLVPLIPL